jgi:hypothetical protein
MIIEFTKIPNGLRWDNQDRLFTYSILSQGYEILGTDLAQIELNNQMYMICNSDSSVDGITFENINDQISYIYS